MVTCFRIKININLPTISKNVPRNLTHFIFLKDYRIGINLPDYEKMYQKYKDDFKTANTMKQADFQKYNNFITVRKNNFRFCLIVNILNQLMN